MKARNTATKRNDKITKELKWQRGVAARRCVQKQYSTSFKQKQMNKQFLGEATDKKQLTCVLNKETGKMLNDPHQCVNTDRAASKSKQNQPQDLQRQGTSDQTTKTKSTLGNMVHTAMLTPSH